METRWNTKTAEKRANTLLMHARRSCLRGEQHRLHKQLMTCLEAKLYLNRWTCLLDSFSLIKNSGALFFLYCALQAQFWFLWCYIVYSILHLTCWNESMGKSFSYWDKCCCLWLSKYTQVNASEESVWWCLQSHHLLFHVTTSRSHGFLLSC